MIANTNSSIQVGIAALLALMFVVSVPNTAIASGGAGYYDDGYTSYDTGGYGYYDDGYSSYDTGGSGYYDDGYGYDYVPYDYTSYDYVPYEYESYDYVPYDYVSYDYVPYDYTTYSNAPSYNYPSYGYSYNPTPVYYYTPTTYTPPTYSYNPPANTCTNGSCNNTCVNGSCNTTVNNPPKEHDKPKKERPVCALSANDTSIEEGDSTTLRWTSENATSATLSSFGSVSTGGSRSVSPSSTKTYTLTVTGQDGSDTCDVTIHVDEEEDDDDLVCELRVSPSTIDEGDEATLRWDIEGATEARINQGVGSVDEDGGDEDVSPDETTTYRLTIENDDGDTEDCSATLRVRNTNSNATFTEDTVYLSDLPYTGSEMDTITTIAYWLSIIGGGGALAWFAIAKGLPLAAAHAFAVRSYEPAEEVVEAPATDTDAVNAFLAELRAGNTDNAIEHIRSAAHTGTGVEEFLASAVGAADADLSAKVSAAYDASQVNGIRGAKAVLEG